MKKGSMWREKSRIIWYRLRRYPDATALSVLLVVIFAWLFSYFIGTIYPNFRLFEKLSSLVGLDRNMNYNFYTAKPGGAYYAIGEAVNGKSADDGDEIKNCETSGGSENAMKLTTEKNSFGLIQEEILNHDDQLRKNIRIVTPLFLERMHIFYRKDILKNFRREVQLSANTDSCILHYISDSARNINMGPVGSGTRILASYIMALIEQQNNKRLGSKTPRFRQLNEPFSDSFEKMLNYKSQSDTSIDILFYVGADPIDRVKDILDSGKYKLMSIEPSFVISLNKEFNLRLREADFKNKYDSANNISTLATFTYLIASKSIRNDDVDRMLNKLHTVKNSIHRALIHPLDTTKSLPLDEFGFFNTFDDEYEASIKLQTKEKIVFLLSVLTLFFPVFRSVFGFKYIWQRWSINRKIDEIVAGCGGTPEENVVTCGRISDLKENVINLYGDGLLSEAQYDPLMKRITMYHEKFSVVSLPGGNLKIMNTDKGLKQA